MTYPQKKDRIAFASPFAEVAELADAQASGACGSNIVWVQVPSSALLENPVSLEYQGLRDFCLEVVFVMFSPIRY